jgi:two-component system, OmpR family, response regulator MtrA
METILIVEDEDYICDMLKLALKRDYHLIFAETKSAALGIIARNNLDLIFTDLSLEDSEGFETLLDILKVSGKTPVVIGTGNQTPGNRERAIKKLGAQDYIFKPYSLRALKDSLQAAIWRGQYLKAQKTEKINFKFTPAQWTKIIIAALVALAAMAQAMCR